MNNAFELKKSGALQLIEPRTPIEYSTVDVYKEVTTRDVQSYYAKTKLQLSSQWQALPSLSAEETLTKLHLDKSIPIKVQYSLRDNLYYVCLADESSPPEEVSIDYVIEVAKNTPRCSPDIFKLVQYCRDFKPGSLKMTGYPNPTGQQYIDALAKQKLGACRHRAAVFMELLSNRALRESIPELSGLQIDTIGVRFIGNQCHAFVEVRQNNQWVQFCLGGYDAKLETNNDAAPRPA